MAPDDGRPGISFPDYDRERRKRIQCILLRSDDDRSTRTDAFSGCDRRRLLKRKTRTKNRPGKKKIPDHSPMKNTGNTRKREQMIMQRTKSNPLCELKGRVNPLKALPFSLQQITDS